MRRGSLAPPPLGHPCPFSAEKGRDLGAGAPQGIFFFASSLLLCPAVPVGSPLRPSRPRRPRWRLRGGAWLIWGCQLRQCSVPYFSRGISRPCRGRKTQAPPGIFPIFYNPKNCKLDFSNPRPCPHILPCRLSPGAYDPAPLAVLAPAGAFAQAQPLGKHLLT